MRKLDPALIGAGAGNGNGMEVKLGRGGLGGCLSRRWER